VQFVLVLVLTFFMLTSGPPLLEQAALWPGRAREVARLAIVVRSELARYLGWLSVINAAVGVVVALVCLAFGLPNAPLWGVLAFALNYIPYVGPASMLAVLFIAGFTSFGSIGAALVLCGTYLAVTTLDGQIIQPLVVGSRLALNPLIVFLALWFGDWLWSVAGLALAVPALAISKAAVCHLRPGGRLAMALDARTGRAMEHCRRRTRRVTARG
jgi:predicted PurR-regulated permease PerM